MPYRPENYSSEPHKTDEAKVEERLIKYQNKYTQNKKVIRQSVISKERETMREVPAINEKSRKMVVGTAGVYERGRVEDRLIQQGKDKEFYLEQLRAEKQAQEQ